MDYPVNRLGYTRELPFLVNKLISNNVSMISLVNKLKYHENFGVYNHGVSNLETDREKLLYILMEMTRERQLCNTFIEVLKSCGQEEVADRIADFNKSPGSIQLRNDIKIPVIPSVSRKFEYNSTYNLMSKPRGLFVIINNMEEPQRVRDPYGLSRETDRFKHIFEKLDFKVQVLKKMNIKQIRQQLSVIREKTSLKKGQAFVMVIISHVKQEKLFGYDGCKQSLKISFDQKTENQDIISDDSIEIKSLVSIFSDANCQNWEAVPKLHFFICLRIGSTYGLLKTEHTAHVQNHDREGQLVKWFENKELLKDTINDNSDTFVCYVCTDEIQFLYDPNVGMSYFGQALTQSIATYACDHPLNDIMLRTSESLKQLYGEVVKDQHSNGKVGQHNNHIQANSSLIEVQTLSLSHNIYFNP